MRKIPFPGKQRMHLRRVYLLVNFPARKTLPPSINSWASDLDELF